jgi:predicted nucleotidyltransferase
VSRVDLFGSAARDEITPESDVDIVTTPKPEATRRDLFIMAADVEDAVSRCVDFFIRADVEAMNNREKLDSQKRGSRLCRLKVIGVAGSFDIPLGNGLARLCKSSRKELQAITFRAAFQNT